MDRPRALALATGVALLALAGCGGGSDKEDAEKVVRAVTEATSKGDGEKLCDLVTKKLLEQSTGQEGDEAKDACEDQVKTAPKRKTELIKITNTEIEGDRATVTAELETQGRKRPQVFKLKKEDGEFRLTGANE